MAADPRLHVIYQIDTGVSRKVLPEFAIDLALVDRMIADGLLKQKDGWITISKSGWDFYKRKGDAHAR